MIQAFLEVGPHDTGCGFRPQRQLSVATVDESIQLLGKRVGVLTRALDQLGVLEDWRDDLLVAEPVRDLIGRPLGRAPERDLVRKDVADAADGFDRFGSGN